MKLILISAVSLIPLLMAFRQIFANHHAAQPDEEKSRYMVYLDFAFIFDVLCDLVDGNSALTGIPFAMLISSTAIFFLSVSFMSSSSVKRYVHMVITIELLSGLWSLICATGMIQSISERGYLFASASVSCCLVIYYVLNVYSRMRNLKYVMRSGSVWANVTLFVDSIYMALILLYACLYLFLAQFFMNHIHVVVIVFTVLFTSVYVALCVRILNISVFVFMTEHERKIVECMKISHVDASVETPGCAMLYKHIYERVLEYFLEEKPYLKNNLTINDIVEVVFSNKLYISRAISQFTGRNFCQFVNYYRVVHAVELYRENPRLKVQELANRSGFNSPVSFGMAFRLFMGEKPGEWCRKEKYRLEKRKK